MITSLLRRLRLLALPALAIALSSTATAQTRVVPISPSDNYAPSGASTNLSAAAATNTSTAPFKWGPFGLRPMLDYQFMHAHGLQQSRGRPLSTDIHTTTAGFVGEIGRRWQVEYMPTWTVYSNEAFRDVIEQHVAVTGAVVRPNWTAEFAQQYASMNAPAVETAEQTAEQTSMTRGSLSWRLPKNLSFSAVGVQNLTFVERLPDRAEWSFAPELDYQLFPSVLIGAGYTVGYVMIYRTADSFYERPLAHVHWQLTRKTSLDASVGADRWEFLGHRHGSLRSLYYSVDLNWSPFAPTMVRLTALRSDSAAAIRAQLSRSDGWGLTLEQRLLGHLHLNAGLNQQTTRYLVDATSTGVIRRDELDSYNAGLRFAFLRHGSFTVFYRSTRNRSNQPGFSFSSHQVGGQIGFKY